MIDSTAPQSITVGISAALTVVFWVFIATPAVAEGGIVPCDSINIRVDIEPTREPVCVAGTTMDVEFSSEYQFIQLHAGYRFRVVSVQRALGRSIFEKPQFESVIEGLVHLGGDPESIEWTTDVDDERFKLQRFNVTTDKSLLPCVGFMETTGRSGSDTKSVLYGYFCNLFGVAFARPEIGDLLSRIRD